eukprot:2174293-Alexandrium_andersonii.AAC.1
MSASSTSHAVMTMSQPSPDGAAATVAAGRLSKEVGKRDYSRRATFSGIPSRAARAARPTGPCARSAGT